MRLFHLFVCFFLFSVLLGGCSSSEKQPSAQVTRLNLGPVDPDDNVLVQNVNAFLKSSEGPVASTYDFARIDLDGDNRRDALVLFKTPYGYWCGTHGCTMLVFKAYDDHFTLLNAIQPVREPVYISDTESRGWKSLVVRVSGRWDKAKDVAMLYDGRQYPENPARLPPFPKKNDGGYTRVFYD